MIAQHYKDMLGSKSVIRQISEWSTARGAEIGYENVFDYSLGNPSVPCPRSHRAARTCWPTQTPSSCMLYADADARASRKGWRTTRA